MRSGSHPSPDPAELLPFGQSGILIRLALTPSERGCAAAQACAARIEALCITGVRHVTSSLTSVLVEFDSLKTSRGDVIAALKPLVGSHDWFSEPAPAPRRRWHVPALFDGDAGPDLADVATLTGLSESDAVAALAGPGLRVLSIGFAPGQPYIGFLDPAWELPRQSRITPNVPAGAIVTAVRQLVLFSNASPTGWRHVGQTGFRPFFPERREPILLRTGDEIRFAPVSPSEYHDIQSGSSDGMGGARCETLA